MEQLFIRIDQASAKIILCVSYLQPKSKKELYLEHSQAAETISNKFPDHQFIFIGDYNLPYVQWKTNPLHYKPVEYIDPNERSSADTICTTYSSLGLQQFLPICDKKGYTLDLLFAPPDLISPIDLREQLLPTDSHHTSHFCKLQHDSIISSTTFKRNFSAANYDTIVSDLCNANWDSVLLDEDLDANVNNFYNILNKAVTDHVPLVKSSPGSYPIWYDHELIKNIQDKKRAHCRWK